MNFTKKIAAGVNFLLSFLLHAIILIAAIMYSRWKTQTKAPESKEIAIEFEFIEESAPEIASNPPPSHENSPQNPQPTPPPNADSDAISAPAAEISLPPPVEPPETPPEPSETPPPPAEIREPPKIDEPEPEISPEKPAADVENPASDTKIVENEVAAAKKMVAQSQVIAPPQARGRIIPLYPKSARRKGREGRVTLEIAVAATGKVESVTVIASSGYPELDHSAEKAAWAADFIPANCAEKSIFSVIKLDFDFRLKKN